MGWLNSICPVFVTPCKSSSRKSDTCKPFQYPHTVYTYTQTDTHKQKQLLKCKTHRRRTFGFEPVFMFSCLPKCEGVMLGWLRPLFTNGDDLQRETVRRDIGKPYLPLSAVGSHWVDCHCIRVCLLSPQDSLTPSPRLLWTAPGSATQPTL